MATRAIVVVLSAVAITLLAGTGSLALGLALTVGAMGAVGLAVLSLRSFAWFVCVAIIARPVLDLTVGRGGSIGPPEALGVLVILVTAGWLTRRRDDVVDLLSQRLTLSLLALAGVAGLAVMSSPHPTASASVGAGFVSGVMLYLAIMVLLMRKDLSLERLFFVLSAAVVIPVLYPILGLVGFPVSHTKDGVTALKSVFWLSNNFAHFLVPFIIFGFASAVLSRGRARWISVAAILAMSAELVFTETRGSWIAVVVGLVAIAALVSWRLLVSSLGAILAVVALVPSVGARVSSILPDPEAEYSESSFTWRLVHWADTLPLASQSPFTGIGFGEVRNRTGKEAHNDFLMFLVESGALGLAVYVWVLYEAIRLALAASRRILRIQSSSAFPIRHVVAAGGLGYLLAFTVASLAENLLENITMQWILMPAIALTHYVAITSEKTPRHLRTTQEALP